MNADADILLDWVSNNLARRGACAAAAQFCTACACSIFALPTYICVYEFLTHHFQISALTHCFRISVCAGLLYDSQSLPTSIRRPCFCWQRARPPHKEAFALKFVKALNITVLHDTSPCDAEFLSGFIVGSVLLS